MPAVKIFFIVLFVIVVLVFAVPNMYTVELSYYDIHLDAHVLRAPLMVVIGCFAFLGFLVAWAVGFIERLKLTSQIRKLRRSNQALTEELERLKAPTPGREIPQSVE